MEIYDNGDSSYKTAGAETYHLPVLYTEDERSSYAVCTDRRNQRCCR